MIESLRALPAFIQVAETLSFTRAGRVLGLTASAVGKTISRLETHIGARLFERDTRNVALTPKGLIFLESARRIVSELEVVEQQLLGHRSPAREKLRVSAPGLGTLLTDAVAGFLRENPETDLEVDLSPWSPDHIRRGYDAVIRADEVIDPYVVVHALGSYGLMLVASPDYLRHAGTPQTPEDLLGHACLHLRVPSYGELERWPIEGGPEAQAHVPVSFTATSVEVLVELAVQGAGIVCVPDFSVHDPLAAGRLQRVLDAFVYRRSIVRAVRPVARRMSPRLRDLLDHISHCLALPGDSAGRMDADHPHEH